MAELLAAIIQFLIEVVAQALISIPFDCTCRVRKKPDHDAIGFSFLFLVIGGAVGWISIHLVPALVHAPVLRFLNLVASPILAGVIGYKIADWQSQSRNPLVVPIYHFWYTFSFTLGLAGVRFAYAN